MWRKICLSFFTLLALTFSFQCWANEYGIAMHGTPLLKDGDSFSYINPHAPKGGTLKQSFVGTFDTINPFTLKGKAAQGLNLFYDRLTLRSWDEPFTLYPLIAKKIIMNNERSFIAFTLDPRARFNDGSQITTDDVVFTFNLLKEKGRPNMRQVYKLVDHVSITAPDTITFTLSKDRNRETPLIIAMMPVLSKKYWSQHNFESTGFDIPLSSGPYHIKSVDAGRRITYERNPNYWAKDLPLLRGLYNFNEISFDYFRDDGVALESFLSGGVDIRTESNPAKWAVGYESPRFASGELLKHDVPHGRTERMWGFIFNLRHSPFDDLNIRHALSLAIDRPWINQNLFHGQYRLTDSFFANSDLAFVSPTMPKHFDLRQNLRDADQILKSAGWIVDHGVRVHAQSHKALSFEILVGSPEDEKVALSYLRTLKKLGVQVNLRSVDSTAFRDRLMRYDYDMVLYFWQNSLSPGTEQALNFGCKAASEEGRFNYSGICTPDIDSLVTKLPNVSSRKELIATTRALDQKLIEAHIAIPLFYAGVDHIAAQSRIGFPSKPALYGTVFEALWDKSIPVK